MQITNESWNIGSRSNVADGESMKLKAEWNFNEDKKRKRNTLIDRKKKESYRRKLKEWVKNEQMNTVMIVDSKPDDRT